ncbi:MAG: tetratricopeptide repeat protein [Ferrovibrio sp.]|uniref:tetratricopeptide repeat protein n=1 Tax=Ferrovibrio sp. TaxID=1917215 RepID=UPI00391972E8
MEMHWHKALGLAVRLHQAGKLEEACQLYRVVLQQQPENDDALHLLGMALEQLGRPQEGLPFVEQAIAAEPGIAAYCNSLGNIYKALEDIDKAVAAYQRALQLDADNADAHNNLGLLAQGRKDWATASRHFNAALKANPGFIEAAFNLAVTDWHAGDRERAVASFAHLMQRNPDLLRKLFILARSELEQRHSDALQKLTAFLEGKGLAVFEWQYLQGGVAELQGDLDTARHKYHIAIAIKPDFPDALRALGRILIDASEETVAAPLLERAYELKPDDTQTIALLATAYCGCHKEQHAAELLERELVGQPNKVALLVSYGHVLGKLNRLDESCAVYERALALSRDDIITAQIYGNLAGVELRRDRIENAEAACQRALELNPDSRLAAGNLANIHEVQGRYQEAEQLNLDLLARNPEDAEAHNNLGLMLLKLGRYAEAWPHFAWRSKSSGWTSPDTSRGLPSWDGVFPPPGRLLIWQEQGIGDEIVFSSLLPELRDRGADAVVATDRRLVPLFARSFPGIKFRPNNEPVDVAALKLVCQRPFGDLGGILRPDAESLAHHPRNYLKADPERRQIFHQRYVSGRDLLVGISWNSRNLRTGSSKSVSLDDMLPLLREPGVAFISLQYGKAAAEAEPFARQNHVPLRHDAEVDPLADIDAQAAQIAALDMVMTVSTAAAHLAAALGVPTLLLLPGTRGQLWYWGTEGETTPWYPSVRICRASPGEGVASMMSRALKMFREMRAQFVRT